MNIIDGRAREPITLFTLEEAAERSDKELWLEAMAKKINSLDDNKVWTSTKLSTKHQLVAKVCLKSRLDHIV